MKQATIHMTDDPKVNRVPMSRPPRNEAEARAQASAFVKRDQKMLESLAKR
jgi:hypothetical protein